MQLGSKKVFLFYSVLCMLHVESDCGTNVKDSTYISCCLYQQYIVLFENSLVNLSSTTTDAFFNFRCNVVKMNCCRIASLKFFSPSLSFSFLLFVCLICFFLFFPVWEGPEGGDLITSPKLSKIPFPILLLQAKHGKWKLS